MQTSPEVCPQSAIYAVARRTPVAVRETEAAELMERAKLRLLEMHYQSKVGHIGGNLSALDILISLYHFRLGPDDEFVLVQGPRSGSALCDAMDHGALERRRSAPLPWRGNPAQRPSALKRNSGDHLRYRKPGSRS